MADYKYGSSLSETLSRGESRPRVTLDKLKPTVENQYMTREELQARINAIEARERAAKPSCLKCGAKNDADRLACFACGAYRSDVSQTDSLSKIALDASPLSIYLWRRLAAKIIDTTIIAAILLCQYLGYLALHKVVDAISMPFLTCLYDFESFGLMAASVLAYRAVFESSLSQATPGKLMLGLMVKDEDGQSVSFAKSLLKGAFEQLPAIIFGVSALAIFISKPVHLQSLEPVSLAVLALVGLCCGIAYLSMQIPIGRENRWRTVLDTLAGCQVEVRSIK